METRKFIYDIYEDARAERYIGICQNLPVVETATTLDGLRERMETGIENHLRQVIDHKKDIIGQEIIEVDI